MMKYFLLSIFPLLISGVKSPSFDLRDGLKHLLELMKYSVENKNLSPNARITNRQNIFVINIVLIAFRNFDGFDRMFSA